MSVRVRLSLRPLPNRDNFMKELCVKCGKRPAEYVSPARWCLNCWTEWWVSGLNIKNEKERQKELKSIRRRLKKKNKTQQGGGPHFQIEITL